jgi:hypothetical protein
METFMPHHTAKPRARRRPFYSHALPKFPIVDGYLHVVGWTAAAPEMSRGMLRHAEAERIFGGPITCVYVELETLEDAIAAGAPAHWRGPWRCLAIAPEGTASLAALLATAMHGRPQA